MTVLKIIAKVIFLPFYFLALLLAMFLFMFGLAINGEISFEECMEVCGIDTYWEL